ncbi:PKD domain-containing protein [Chloroflexota bacterium]
MKKLLLRNILVLVFVTVSTVIIPGKSVEAYDNVLTHPYIVEQAAALYLAKYSGAINTEILQTDYTEYGGLAYVGWDSPYSFLGAVKSGAYDEDENDFVYNHEGVMTTINHFWDADAGDYDLVKNIIFGEDYHPNAYTKAKVLWQYALNAYAVGQSQTDPGARYYFKWWAYKFLGHVCHLLADMSVPAHAHEDFHADDCYEDWVHQLSDIYVNLGPGYGISVFNWQNPWVVDRGLVNIPNTIPEDYFDSEGFFRLYYLMYTTNQYGDYFASDDENGDSYDRHGWLDYTGWPLSPIFDDQFEDNDEDDSDFDGDLTRIASYSLLYSIRSTATLFTVFNEVVQQAQEINIYAAVVNAGADGNINEGSIFNSAGFFVDALSTWTATVDYGDGSGTQSLALTDVGTFILSHKYSDNGTYTVMVTVSDAEANTGFDTAQVTVANVAPAVSAGIDTTIDEGSTFTGLGYFTDPGEDTWIATVDYNDGSGAQSLTLDPDKTFALNHTYSDNGIYTIAVTVADDDGGVGSDTVLVTVNDLSPIAAFVWTPEPQDEGAAITFTDTSVSSPDIIVAWDWEFNGLGNSIDQNPTFTFMDNSVYTVALTVTDEDGSTDTVSHEVTVNDLGPTAVLTGDTLLDERQTGHYDASGSTSSPDAIVLYEWDWDYDGSIFNPSGDTGALQSHAWNDDSVYTVAVRVTDDDGSTDIATLAVTVQNPPPEVMVENLSEDIDVMESLPASIINSLTTSLDTANKVLNDSNPKNDKAAINTLGAFINKIEAQRGKKIPIEIADDLIAEAQEIIEEISGGA